MLHYLCFTRHILPKPNAAHLVHDVQTANAVANLGYKTVLVYLKPPLESLNPIEWLFPFRPRTLEPDVRQFYSLHDRLKASPLPMPWPIGEHRRRLFHPSTWVCKYYVPMHLARHAGVVHTLDWNLVKTAIALGIPVIYEREHYPDHHYDPQIVQHPLFQVAVTVAEPIRARMVQQGMPPEKIVQLPLGYNQSFVMRSPHAAAWRQRLLPPQRRHLGVYAGGLYRFKGVDLLLQVAEAMPQVQFVFAGGNEAQVAAYQAKGRSLANVKFLGYLPQQELSPLLQAADAVLHPHCSGEAATFTSPLKFFDYLASGTPIVATEIPPLMEFKGAPAPIGWCRPDDPIQFQQQLKNTLAQYPYRSEGYPARPDFLQRFSWEARLQKILEHVEPSILEPLR
jgi:glycosyltransferase involved in cell wall biosynthesis